MASGFPDNVPAWYTFPSGEMTSIISFFPPYAPTGNPPPIIFPRVVISGVIPYTSWAPPNGNRNPVITSSKMSTTPYWVQSFRRPWRYSACGSTQPILPTTGSRMRAATSFLFSINRRSTYSTSLKGAMSVSFAVPAVTPGLSGLPKVNAPLPAAIRKESPWPW